MSYTELGVPDRAPSLPLLLFFLECFRFLEPVPGKGKHLGYWAAAGIQTR